jgi:nucleoside-diphosphate-sugar epimerase
MKANRPIELYEGGEFYRTYMDIEDCVTAIRMVLGTGNLNEIYNIGTYPPVYFLDAIRCAYAMTNSISEIKVIRQKEFHKKVQVKSFYMNCDKLYALGFKPKHNLVSTISRMI